MSKGKALSEEERLRHVEEMKGRVLRLVKDPDCFYMDSSMDIELQEKFLEQILFMEECDEQPLFEYLEKKGVRLPAPVMLDDTQLCQKLWEVIRAMASTGHYLSSTDHLSDRQLYERLWSDILRQPTCISPDPSTTCCHIDILGGCSEDDQKTRLKYYADDDERECWACDFPEDEIPPREPLPYDRDRYLPVPGNSAF
jgi:hypothetical protein